MSRPLPLAAVLVLLLAASGCPKPTSSTDSGEASPPPQAQDSSGGTDVDSTDSEESGPTPEELAAQALDEARASMRAALQQNGEAAAPYWRQAESALDRYLELSPADDQARLNRALAQLHLKNFEEAAGTLRRLSDRMGDDPAVWLALGQALDGQGDAQGARLAYERGLAVDPENAQLMAAILGALRAAGQLSAAEERAKALLAVNANSIQAYNELGLTYMAMGEPQLARFVFLKALQSVDGADDTSSIHSNLGIVWMELEDDWQARASFQRALELDPMNASALINQGYVDLRNNNFESALNGLLQAQAQLPDDTALQLNLAVARRGVQDYAGARSLYESILEREPDNADAIINLAILAEGFEEDLEAAIAGYNRYLEVVGASAERSAEVQEWLEDAEKALERQRRREERNRRRRARQQSSDSGGSGASGGQQFAPSMPLGGILR